jgi:hypothetical protein
MPRGDELMAASKGAGYMRRRRAERKAGDQRPENRERVRERKGSYRVRHRWAIQGRDRDRYWQLRDEGRCTKCGEDASGALCRRCHDAATARRIERDDPEFAAWLRGGRRGPMPTVPSLRSLAEPIHRTTIENAN